MTDHEFIEQVRRGLLMIMTAFIKRYSLSWLDFLPRDAALSVPMFVWRTVDDKLKQD